MNLKTKKSHGLACRQAVGLKKSSSFSKSKTLSSLYHNGQDCQHVYLDTPQGTRNVGVITTDENGQRFLVKQCTEAKHLHRKFDAWGIDAELLDELPDYFVKYIRVLTDKGTVEEATVETWRERGIRRDFGFGLQVFLPRKFFKRTLKEGTQPSLFGGE